MTMQSTEITGRVETNEYTTEQLPDNWDDMSDSEKMSHLQNKTPVDTNVTYNTTVNGLHEYFAQNLDPTQSVDESATHLALGIDNTAPDVNNTSLNNEVFRKQVTDHSQTSNELLASTFIGSDEANNETINEVGLFTAADESGGFLLNHSTIATIEKDSSRTITLDITLTFDAA